MFQPNLFGLHDVHGNVSEWVHDCYNDSYSGAPTDERPVVSAARCDRVLRGGSWGDNPGAILSAKRRGYIPDDRNFNDGFRTARTLE